MTNSACSVVAAVAAIASFVLRGGAPLLPSCPWFLPAGGSIGSVKS